MADFKGFPEAPLAPEGSDAEMLEALRDGKAALLGLTRWVDAGNAHRDPEALLLYRLIKLTEESGEVMNALSGATGANPRKGITNGFDEVLDELLDVAVTALGAYEHIDSYRGRSIEALLEKVTQVAERAGIGLGPKS